MARNPDECRYRTPILNSSPPRRFPEDKGRHARTGDEAGCELVRRILGLKNEAFYPVGRDACEACCQYPLPAPGTINPVVASVLYHVAGKALARGHLTTEQTAQTLQVQRYALDHMAKHSSLTVEASGSEIGQTAALDCHANGNRQRQSPRTDNEPAGGTTHQQRMVWATGLITAPRRRPTIERTLRSLRSAGFESVHIFAEPGASIPRKYRHLPVTIHGETLGNLGNFYTALVALSMSEPHADCYAIFQDDIEVPVGLKDFCEREFWPCDTPLVSLCTMRAHCAETPGWRVLHLGYHRTFGGQALVFRRDILQQFLTDGLVFQVRQKDRHGDDAVVGEWATRQGIGIAYHTPSLVTHIGETSAIAGHVIGRQGTADGVSSVRELSTWQPTAPRAGRIGLVGWNTATGLGYQNRDIAAQLDVDRWLIPIHPHYPTLPDPDISGRIDYVPARLKLSDLKRWLKGLDWVLFVELPYLNRLPQLPQHARQMGISVACVPNWEWTAPECDWLKHVDLMICPTRHTFRHFSDWKDRFGFTWDLLCVPWPVDCRRIPFRPRDVCQRFLFVNGTGGCPAWKPDGSETVYSRKGIEVLSETARRLPDVTFIVYSQTETLPPLPANVELRDPPACNTELYRDGDVCVQPSHWEGLGLQLLECQAAGLPLVTTDAPPMNEYRPFRCVPVRGQEVVSLHGNQPFAAQNPSPEDLAEILASIHGTDVGEASRRARRFVEEQHSWERAGPLMLDRMVH